MGSVIGAAALQAGSFEIGRESSRTLEPTGRVDSIFAAKRSAPSPVPTTCDAFPEKEYVDLARTARILGVTDSTVMALFSRGLIEIIDYAPRKRKRVRYQSIVDFCDALRTRYAIKDRRPALDNPLLRHRDADLLPFPIEDTIAIEQVAEILSYSSFTPVRLMIEEGRFDAYQFYSFSPWRISKLSLGAYLGSLKQCGGRAAQNRVHPWG
jgi:hypothetical protein